MMAESDAEHVRSRQHRSERLLATLAPFARVVLVSHVNPDPDAMASMLGLQALLACAVLAILVVNCRKRAPPAPTTEGAGRYFQPVIREGDSR